MGQYPLIENALRTLFNAEDGLSLEVSKRLYVRSCSPGALLDLKEELQRAFQDPSVSWRQMLCSERYEVRDLESEEEAKAVAHEILVAPLGGESL
jgi:hypothetical protein